MTYTYGALLREPGARPLLGALLAAWLSFGMVALSILLAVRGAAGSYLAAGWAVAAFSVGSSALAPVRGRLVDRCGPRRTLPPLALGYAAGLCALAVAVAVDAPAALLVALALASGISAPPLVATTRGLWSHVVPRDGLRVAYAATSVVGDVMLVAAPALAGVLAIASGPAALVLTAVSGVAGATVVASRSPRAPDRTSEPRRVGVLSSGPMRRVLVVSIGLGAALGVVEVAVPAAAEVDGRRALAGVLLGAFALGSAVAALWFGRRPWRTPALTRYLVAVVGLALALAPLALAGAEPVLLGAVLVVAGAAYGPATVSLFELLDDVAPAGGGTEALTWITTAEGAGIAAGAAAAGVVVTWAGIRWAFALAPAVLLVALSLGMGLRLRSLVRRAE